MEFEEKKPLDPVFNQVCQIFAKIADIPAEDIRYSDRINSELQIGIGRMARKQLLKCRDVLDKHFGISIRAGDFSDESPKTEDMAVRDIVNEINWLISEKPTSEPPPCRPE